MKKILYIALFLCTFTSCDYFTDPPHDFCETWYGDVQLHSYPKRGCVVDTDLACEISSSDRITFKEESSNQGNWEYRNSIIIGTLYRFLGKFDTIKQETVINGQWALNTEDSTYCMSMTSSKMIITPANPPKHFWRIIDEREHSINEWEEFIKNNPKIRIKITNAYNPDWHMYVLDIFRSDNSVFKHFGISRLKWNSRKIALS